MNKKINRKIFSSVLALSFIFGGVAAPINRSLNANQNVAYAATQADAFLQNNKYLSYSYYIGENPDNAFEKIYNISPSIVNIEWKNKPRTSIVTEGTYFRSYVVITFKDGSSTDAFYVVYENEPRYSAEIKDEVPYTQRSFDTKYYKINSVIGDPFESLNISMLLPIARSDFDFFKNYKPKASYGSGSEGFIDGPPELNKGRFEWVVKPDTSFFGEREATIKVIFSNGSTRNVKLPYVVNETGKRDYGQSIKYTPVAADSFIVNSKEDLNSRSSEAIKNFSSLPTGTKVSFDSQNLKVGTNPMTATVTYPDKSTDPVSVNVIYLPSTITKSQLDSLDSTTRGLYAYVEFKDKDGKLLETVIKLKDKLAGTKAPSRKVEDERYEISGWILEN
jgi:Rib/alpha/Esp surface antigen-like repeat protein